MNENATKLSHEEFILRAIRNLRKPPYKGIHTVYSGFNQAFRDYFPGDNPITAVLQLKDQGIVATKPVKGGVMLYLVEDAPNIEKPADVLNKIVGGTK